jgi:hypothetical protein
MAKPKEYGSPLGTPDSSGDETGRNKVRPPDADVVRAALKKASPKMPTASAVPAGAPRQSSQTTPRKLRPPAILDAEIERQSK